MKDTEIAKVVTDLYLWVCKWHADVTEKCINTDSKWVQHGLDGYILAYHNVIGKMLNQFPFLRELQNKEEKNKNGL